MFLNETIELTQMFIKRPV